MYQKYLKCKKIPLLLKRLQYQTVQGWWKSHSSLSARNFIHPNEAPQDTTEVQDTDICEVK